MLSLQYAYYEFNYADIILEGYGKDQRDSSQLLKEIIRTLNDPNFKKDKRTIDRFKNRSGSEKRLLVHISAPFEKEGRRIFGKIALIKNKAIFLLDLNQADLIKEIEKPGNKEFVELTNYSITFDPKPIIMVEFNSSGPRLSDIEYYFRQISKDMYIAKSVRTTLHLSIDYKRLSTNIDNIYGIAVKVKANEIYKSKDVDWHDGLKKLKDAAGYRDVKLEFLYPRITDPNTNKLNKNIIGIDFARSIIDWLTKKPENIENIDDLKMTYQETGSDAIVDLDFIKNKTTSVVSIPINNVIIRQQFNFEVGSEFNKYLLTTTTTIDKKQ
jgi:hypothetical protein